MSELSAAQYKEKARKIIDSGIFDPDLIFQKLINYYLKHDPLSDWFYDTQDDIEELFDGLADILAKNFKGEPPGSLAESEDAKRFRKVRNWVENAYYDNDFRLKWNNPQNTNPSRKFNRQMDKVMHLIGGAELASYIGESVADVGSVVVELADEAKMLWKRQATFMDFGYRVAHAFPRHPEGIGFDRDDLNWGLRGSGLQNSFDLNSDKQARNLAVKFGNGTFLLSRYEDWYNKKDNVLYE